MWQPLLLIYYYSVLWCNCWCRKRGSWWILWSSSFMKSAEYIQEGCVAYDSGLECPKWKKENVVGLNGLGNSNEGKNELSLSSNSVVALWLTWFLRNWISSVYMDLTSWSTQKSKWLCRWHKEVEDFSYNNKDIKLVADSSYAGSKANSEKSQPASTIWSWVYTYFFQREDPKLL